MPEGGEEMSIVLLVAIIALVISIISCCLFIHTKKTPNIGYIRREEQCLSEWQIAEEIKRRKNRELYLQELTEVLYESALNKVTKDFYEKALQLMIMRRRRHLNKIF